MSLRGDPIRSDEDGARALAVEAEIKEVRVADDFERAFRGREDKARRSRHPVIVPPPMYDASKQVGEIVLAKRFLLISLFGQRETRSGAELLASASGLSFCCLAWFSISSLSAGGSRSAHVQ